LHQACCCCDHRLQILVRFCRSTTCFVVQAVHVASQYGQTAFVNHIIVDYAADYNALDIEGRSPLHWAAYNGFTETVRLLLFRDACQNRQDNTGCTPLHWAVIKENVEACTLLVHAGTKEELILKDNTGSTPLKLASDKVEGNANS